VIFGDSITPFLSCFVSLSLRGHGKQKSRLAAAFENAYFKFHYYRAAPVLSSGLAKHVQFAFDCLHFGFQVAQVIFQALDIIVTTQGDHIAMFAAASARAATPASIMVMSRHSCYSLKPGIGKIVTIK
jgi:hypothetical protein